MSKNLPYLLAIVVGFLALTFFSWRIYSYFQPNLNPSFSQIPTPTSLPTPTPDPDRDFSILLLGYAGGNHDGSSLTDSIVLATIKPHQQKINLVSIPRDLWVNIRPGEAIPSYAKINFALPSGGGELVKKIIGQVTGITPERYLAVDFNGFIKAVDQLGGIDLKITQSFSDPFYPIESSASSTCGKSPEEITALTATMSGDKLDQQFTCRYETLVFNIGTTHLNGATALKYVRSRHSPQSGGDFNRSLRQKQVILAVRDRVLSLNFFTKIIPIYKTLSSHLRTDLTLGDIEHYLLRALEFSKYTVENLSLNDKNVLMITTSATRQSILVPTSGLDNYQAVYDYLNKSGN